MHTLNYPRSWMMWLTLSLLIERLSASCWLVMHWTLQMMASACCSISVLTAVTGWPEWGKSGISVCFSCFGSRRCFHPVTNSASVNCSISIDMEDVFACFWLTLSQQQEIKSQHGICSTCHWLTALWGTAAVSKIFTALYLNAGNSKFILSEITFLILFLGKKKKYGALLFWATYMSSA